MFSRTTATTKVARLKKRIRAVQGGTSASKTISILLFLIWKCQTDKEERLTSVVSESIPHLKRGAMRDFLNIMKAQGYFDDNAWNKTDSTYTFPTGSKMEFFSTDNADKLRGARRDRLFMNECNNLTFDSFEQLEVRTKEFIYLDWNPTNEFWFYTEVLTKRTDVDHIVLTYLDNEALSQEIVDTIEQRKNRPGWWKVYGLGQLGEVDGKIYKDWVIIEDLPVSARFLRYGLDFGYTNDPSCLVAIYYHDGITILHEVFYKKGMSNREIGESILAHNNGLVIADSAEPKSIDEIKTFGINVIGANKGKDSVLNGIQYIQDQKIAVTGNSANIIREYNNYLWEVDRDGKILNEPEHKFSHSMDAIRYGMNFSINYKPTSMIQTGGVLPFYDDLGY